MRHVREDVIVGGEGYSTLGPLNLIQHFNAGVDDCEGLKRMFERIGETI